MSAPALRCAEPKAAVSASPAQPAPTAHGTVAGLPHSSPLTKLASRPKNSPIGLTTAR